MVSLKTAGIARADLAADTTSRSAGRLLECRGDRARLIGWVLRRVR